MTSIHFPFSRLRTFSAALASLAAISLVLTGCGSGKGTTAVSAYTAQDLGQFAQYSTFATDINNDGIITGNYYTGSSTGADGIANLPLPCFYANGAFQSLIEQQFYTVGSVNDAGQITGTVYSNNYSDSAAVYENGKVRLLGSLARGNTSRANAINNAGQVVGNFGRDGVVGFHAVLWENGGVRDLGTLGGDTSNATALNDAGQIIGSSTVTLSDNRNQPQTFLYENGAMRALETLPGTAYSFAGAINNRKQIVGSVVLQSDPTTSHAFVWENGVMQKLGTLGGKSAGAAAINEAGQIVGSSEVSPSVSHAVLWQNGNPVDLNPYLPYPDANSSAAAINDRGQIVVNVQQTTPEGYPTSRLILLTPKSPPAPQ